MAVVCTPPTKSRLQRVIAWLLATPPERKMAYSSGKKKIAFIKRGPFSHTNMRVNELLASSFPEYDVEVIDLDEEIFLRRKQAVLCNVLHIWRIYGLDLLSGKRTLRECFYRTPFMFRYIKRVIDHKLGGRLGEFVFSIQTQSLYDASVPSLPHFVYTDHTHLANLYYPAFDAALLFARDWIDYEREIYLAATRVFIMSNHVGKSIVEHYGGNPDRITCVYAGSNVETTAAPLQNDNYGNRNILFVGVEWERKGGPLLVAAFRKVREALPDATLTIVGSSPNVEGEGVAVLGRMPLAQVEEHLLRSSVFCMPTKVEPFGIAPIEALVHRIPVVASRIGALPDIVQHGKTGLLVAPDSVDELAAALIDLLSHPEKCRAFGELGHRLVRETYTWEAVGRRMKTQIAADIREANPA